MIYLVFLFLKKNKLIFNAYYADSFEKALKQLLFFYKKFITIIKIKFNYSIQEIYQNFHLPKNLFYRFQKKYTKIYYDYLLYYQSKNEKIQLSITINV